MKKIAIFLLMIALVSCATLNESSIKVNGSYKAYESADLINIHLKVEALSESNQESASIVGSSTDKIKDLMNEFNIDNSNLVTAEFSMQDVNSWEKDQYIYKGQKVTHAMILSLDFDVQVMAKLLDKLALIPNISIDYINFDLKDKSNIVRESREMAIKNAIEKAQTYAQAANLKLSSVIEIEDVPSSSMYESRNMPMLLESKSMDVSSIQLSANKIAHQSSVMVKFRLLK